MSKKHWKNPSVKTCGNHGKNRKRKPIARSVLKPGVGEPLELDILCTDCVRNLGTDGFGVNMSVLCEIKGAYLYFSHYSDCTAFVKESDSRAIGETGETFS